MKPLTIFFQKRFLKSHKKLYDEGRKYYLAGDFCEALPYLEKVHDLAPRYANCSLLYTQCARKAGQADAWQKAAKALITHYPEKAQAWLEHARWLEEQEQPELAYDSLYKAWVLKKDNPNTVRRLLKMALFLRKTENLQDIAGAFEPHVSSAREACGLFKALGLCNDFESLNRLTQKFSQYAAEPVFQQAVGEQGLRWLKLCQQTITESNDKKIIDGAHRRLFSEDPGSRTRPFYESIMGEALREWHQAPAPVSPPPEPRDVLRICFVASGNWHFIDQFLTVLEHDPAFEVVRLDIRDVPAESRPPLEQIAGKIFLKQNADVPIDENSAWGKTLQSVDLVFCEWCNYAAVWLGCLKDLKPLLLCRLHRYEAFCETISFVRFSRYQKLFFVAPQIQKFVQSWLLPPVAENKQLILPNFNSSARLPKVERTGVEKTIAMIGYSRANKDPLCALKILNGLLSEDPNWKLVLIGHPYQPSGEDDPELPYFQDFENFIHSHNLEGRVRELGYFENISQAHPHFSFILSVSHREGTHESVIQAMASGAIPVIRDWPVLKKIGGARGIFDDQWIVETADEAVERLREISSDPHQREHLAEMARQEFLEKWDMERILPKYTELLRSVIAQ